jgi:hypothetical protein
MILKTQQVHCMYIQTYLDTTYIFIVSTPRMSTLKCGSGLERSDRNSTHVGLHQLRSHDQRQEDGGRRRWRVRRRRLDRHHR